MGQEEGVRVADDFAAGGGEWLGVSATQSVASQVDKNPQHKETDKCHEEMEQVPQEWAR